MPQTVLAQVSTGFRRILPTRVYGPVQTTCVHRLRTRVVCSLYRLKLGQLESLSWETFRFSAT